MATELDMLFKFSTVHYHVYQF